MPCVRFFFAHNADHVGAAPGRELHCGLSDLAIGAEDQDALMGFRQPGPSKALDCGDEWDPDSGRLVHGHRRGFFDQRRRLDDEMRRMRPVAPDAQIAGRTEHFLADPFRRTIDDEAREIAARRSRKHRIGHQSGGRLEVGWIDARRLDLDDGLICPT